MSALLDTLTMVITIVINLVTVSCPAPGKFRLAGSMVAMEDVEEAIRELRAEVNHSVSSRFADL